MDMIHGIPCRVIGSLSSTFPVPSSYIEHRLVRILCLNSSGLKILARDSHVESTSCVLSGYDGIWIGWTNESWFFSEQGISAIWQAMQPGLMNMSDDNTKNAGWTHI